MYSIRLLRTTEKPVKERKVTALTEIKDKFPYFVSLLDTPHTRGRPELREEDVKGECLADRLRRNIQYWEGIGSSDFVLDIIKTGYKIPFIHTPLAAYFRNNKSVRDNPAFVTASIQDLLRTRRNNSPLHHQSIDGFR